MIIRCLGGKRNRKPADSPCPEIDRQIVDYIRWRLGIDEAEHGIDPEEYLAFVHDVPVEQHLSADRDTLRKLLSELLGR